MALYRFFQRKERPVVPTLSMCGASSLSTKELERANDHVSRVLCPGDGESAKFTPTTTIQPRIGKYAVEGSRARGNAI